MNFRQVEARTEGACTLPGSLLQKFDKELETVIAANPDIDPHAIMPGQQINIPCS